MTVKHGVTIAALCPVALLLYALHTPVSANTFAKEHAKRYPLCQPWAPLIAAPKEPLLAADDALTQLQANEVIARSGERMILRGDVRIARAAQQLAADIATYDERTRSVEVNNGMRFQDGDFALRGTTAHMELDADRGRFSDAEFWLYKQHARGRAGLIIKENASITRLERASYTTCNPDEEDWYLSATNITLDRQADIGSARHVVVRFKGIPFLYTPYISFPLSDKRKSGFLPPSIGVSGRSGTTIALPYYWNIAPRVDATLTPNNMTARGTQLLAELRYLNPASRGQLDAEYLASDKKFGGKRELYTFRHNGNFGPQWTLDIALKSVSDKAYFTDMGNSLVTSNISHLERRLDLTYLGDYGRFRSRLQTYQTVDDAIAPGSRPYQRLPQLQYSTPSWEGDYLRLDMDSELVNFEREESLSGWRLAMEPNISAPFESLATTITPKLTLHHTQYELDPIDPSQSSSFNRTVPIFSLDSGLFLERDSQWGDSELLQTLEPRLFYLYAPFEDQSQLPLFDTSLPLLSFPRLFAENRFSGLDRVGDANQISAALTTRFLDKSSGKEYFSASIGQIFYLRDRQVMLSGSTLDERHKSDIVAEAVARLGSHWSAKLNLQWGELNNEAEKGAFQINYRRDNRRLFNLGYRFTRTPALEQLNGSFAWPLTTQWSVVAQANYSLEEQRTLDTLHGLEYNSCCWALRILSEEHIINNEGDMTRSLSFEFELKGMATIGRSIRDTLKQRILGYTQ
ncbi:MAG: LPS-assembly protein LptD [Gammaproteobacteria bacterium]|nr:LPS-assembly protein LptD [Gammaproteobacteria bacterium]